MGVPIITMIRFSKVLRWRNAGMRWSQGHLCVIPGDDPSFIRCENALQNGQLTVAKSRQCISCHIVCSCSTLNKQMST